VPRHGKEYVNCGPSIAAPPPRAYFDLPRLDGVAVGRLWM
jgi:hypothetical protein